MADKMKSSEELLGERKDFIKENFIELNFKFYKLFIRKEDIVSFWTDLEGRCYIEYRYVNRFKKIKYRSAMLEMFSDTAEMIRKSHWWSTRFNVK